MHSITKRGIILFLEGEEKSTPLAMLPLSEYDDVLNELGYSSKNADEYPKNEESIVGWEGAFSYSYINKENKSLTLQGSLWYGEFKLIKDE